MLLLLLIHIEYLKINDIEDILDVKDNRAVKKWLNDNGIPISTISGKSVVDKFTFEFKRQQLLVEELRISYPNNWFEIYNANTTDKGMVQSIRAIYPDVKLVKKANSNTTKRFIK